MSTIEDAMVVVIYPSELYAQCLARDIFPGTAQYLAVPNIIISAPMSRDDAVAATQLLRENGISKVEMFHKEHFEQPLRIDAAGMFGTSYQSRMNGRRFTLIGIWGDRWLFDSVENNQLFIAPVALVADAMIMVY